MKEYNITRLQTNLQQKGYIVNIFDTKESAANYIDQQINEKTVGMGGSVTIHQMNMTGAEYEVILIKEELGY